MEADPAVVSAMDGNQIFGLITLGRHADAERLLQRALARDPENAGFHYARLQIYEATGRLPEARDSLERLASLEIRDGSFTAFMKMKALKLLGRLDEALDAVDAALGFEPSQGYLLHERGKLLWALGRAEEALLAFDAATAGGSGWASLFAKSRILSTMGRDEEAHLSLLEALKHHPNDEAALCTIARQLADVGARQKALECADRARKLNPRYYEAWTLKARLLEEAGRVAEAEEVLRHLLEERPGDLAGCIQLIGLLHGTGRAIGEHVQAALRSRPRHGEEYLLKGSFVKGLGFFREALQSLDAGVALEPGQALGWMWKGDAHVYVSEFDQADLAYRRALLLKPQDVAVRAKIVALGALREGHRLIENDPRGALELYERAVLSDPDNGAFLYAQAAALGLLGRPGAALPLLDRCIPTLERLSWTPVFEKIRCLAELCLFDEANALAAQAASQLDPGPDRDRMERIVASGIRSERSRQDVARGWHDMANQHQRAQELEPAEECFRRATYVNPDEAAHAGALAGCLMILSERRPGALAESIAISERLLSRVPDHPPVLFNYAQALHMAGRHQEALAVAQQLARLTPDDPDLRGLFLGIQSALDRSGS